MKPLDLAKALGTRNGHDVLPFFVSLQDLVGDLADRSVEAAVLKDLPHMEYSIVTVFGMSSRCTLTLNCAACYSAL